MDRGRRETGRNIGEEKEVKKVNEKQVGERQGEGAQGLRREAVCFQTISYIVAQCRRYYSIAVFTSC